MQTTGRNKGWGGGAGGGKERMSQGNVKGQIKDFQNTNSKPSHVQTVTTAGLE